jgi:hypothetical protein
MITIPKKELKTVIKESVREAISQELMKLRALILPFISQKEQKNIEKKYIKPSRKSAKIITIEL